MQDRFSGTSRRDLLKTLTAAGLGGPAAHSALIAQNGGNGAANPRRIDVHQHLQLPGSRGGLSWWTPEKALEQMDKHGIETTILSRPGGEADAGGEQPRAFARRVNEYAAKIVSDHPKRFGFFAVIPYPDAEGSVREIEYAFDTLKADGAGLMSSIGDKYAGDPASIPLAPLLIFFIRERFRSSPISATSSIIPAPRFRFWRDGSRIVCRAIRPI